MCAAIFNDDDVKIAPSDLSKLFQKENPVADDNIDLYLRQRSLGNTLKARRLGKEYVSDLFDCVWTKAPTGVDPALFDTQVKVLFAYVVHRIIEDYSDNHIVANTAISSFYEQLEQEAPALFDVMCNSTAFSMYLYTHRSGHENAQTVGKVFAALCDAKDSEDCAVIGEAAYARFVGACAQRMITAGYRTDSDREGDSHGA
jgi:hypothetical protein